MTITPFPWQQRDALALRDAGYVGLLNMEVGAGKTVVAVEAIRLSGAKVVLIIGPESTYETAWKSTVAEMGGPDVRRIGNGRKADKEALADFLLGYPGWYFATTQFFTRSDSVQDWSGDALIVDEVHLLNAAKSKGQRRLSGFSASDGQPISRRFRYRLALSGTPARNHFDRMWGVMRFLWPDLDGMDDVAYHNYWNWQNLRMTSRNVYTSQRDSQGNAKQVKQYMFESEPGRLISEAPCVVQHFRRSRCCDAHPAGFLSLHEPQVLNRPVEMLSAQTKAIKELEEQYLTWLDQNPMVVEFPITLHQRIRQVALGVPTVDEKGNVTFDPECKSPVVDEVLDILEHLGEEPAMVYVDSQKFAAVLNHRLNKAGVPSFEFSGQTTSTRGQDFADFCAGRKYRVCVGVLSAIGTGTNGAQNRVSNEIVVQYSLDETTNEQVRGRLDRTGQQRQVQRYHVTDSLGLFEGRLTQALAARVELNKSLRKAA